MTHTGDWKLLSRVVTGPHTVNLRCTQARPNRAVTILYKSCFVSVQPTPPGNEIVRLVVLVEAALAPKGTTAENHEFGTALPSAAILVIYLLGIRRTAENCNSGNI